MNINSVDYGQNNQDLFVTDDTKNVYVAITKNKINLSYLIEKHIKNNLSGGISIFLGTTKEYFNNKKVKSLEYEYHPTMALKTMFKLALDHYLDLKLNKVLIVHRVGLIPISEESIAIISSSEGREAAIKSTSNLINEVKKLVPIWKKEIYVLDNGEEEINNTKSNVNCIHSTNKCTIIY